MVFSPLYLNLLFAWFSRTPHFAKSFSSRFTQKCNKIGWGWGIGQISQEVVSEILEKQAKNGFYSKVLVSKKCFNTAGRGILSQSRMHMFKPFLGSCSQTHSFQYLLLSQLEHTAGYRDPCLLPLLKQSYQNDLTSLYHNVHEMIQIATTRFFAEAS